MYISSLSSGRNVFLTAGLFALFSTPPLAGATFPLDYFPEACCLADFEFLAAGIVWLLLILCFNYYFAKF